MELENIYSITKLLNEAVDEFYYLEFEIPNKDEGRWSRVGEILRKINPFDIKWDIDAGLSIQRTLSKVSTVQSGNTLKLKLSFLTIMLL